jgi:cytochrome c oxidase cbb3-type subunit I/II
LGVPYTDEELNNTAEVAFKQAEAIAAEIVAQGGPASTFDKQAIAVIAYLQRMGTDLFRTPEPEGEPAAPADGAPAEGAAEETPAEVADAADAGDEVAMADAIN